MADHQCVAADGSAAGAGGKSGGAKSGNQVGFQGLPGGSYAEDERAREGGQQAEQQNALIELSANHYREVAGDFDGLEKTDAAIRHSQTKRAAAQSEDKALNEELAKQTQAAGADGQPNRDFARPGTGLGQQQVRDVGAGDDQHQSG